MPILWRYLLRHYCKFFLLSVGTFVALLLVMRSQEIARFAAFSANPTKVLWFILCQLPYILPFAIPLSGLISSTILLQTLSQTEEWTALRACGASLSSLLTPLLLTGSLLSLLNFVIVSELGPYCKLESISLLHKSIEDNPLLMFKKNKFLTIKDTFVDLTLTKDPAHSKEFILAFLDPSSKKLSLITAQELYLEKGILTGKHLAMISSLQDRETTDDTLLENNALMVMKAEEFTSLLKSSHRRVRYEQLPTKLCLIKMLENSPSKSAWKKGLFELYKRSFFTLAPLTFILLGISFGMEIGRNSHKKHLIMISLLTTFLFLSYIIGKTLHKRPSLALLVYILPQILVWVLCIRSLKRVQEGYES